MCIASEFAFAAGVDYNARKNYNMSLDNEFYAGDIQEDEYYGSQLMEADLWSKGGRVVKSRAEGPGICRPHTNLVLPPPSALSLSGRPKMLGGQRVFIPGWEHGAQRCWRG